MFGSTKIGRISGSGRLLGMSVSRRSTVYTIKDHLMRRMLKNHFLELNIIKSHCYFLEVNSVQNILKSTNSL